MGGGVHHDEDGGIQVWGQRGANFLQSLHASGRSANHDEVPVGPKSTMAEEGSGVILLLQAVRCTHVGQSRSCIDCTAVDDAEGS